MIEFTTSEFIFLIWDVVATWLAFKYHHELGVAKYVTRQLITNKEIRDRVVADYEAGRMDR